MMFNMEMDVKMKGRFNIWEISKGALKHMTIQWHISWKRFFKWY
jgi:hypothetical protein